MASITVNKLTTSNTTPTLTGTVSFERFDTEGKPKETIEVYVNYGLYTLFDGNLGLDESVTPNVWKLRFDTPLRAGIYSVNAVVRNISDGAIVATDSTEQELSITSPTPQEVRNQNLTLPQKVAVVAGLLNGLSRSFGGQSGVGGNPAVHPTLDDDSSTTLRGRGSEEGNNEPRHKSRKARADKMKVETPPIKHPFQSTGISAEDAAAVGNAALEQAADIAPPSSADILSQLGDVERAMATVSGAPDEAAALSQQQYSSTPTSSFG